METNDNKTNSIKMNASQLMLLQMSQLKPTICMIKQIMNTWREVTVFGRMSWGA